MFFKYAPRTKKTKPHGDRKGVAAVEFATVAPLLILMIFLMIEASRYLMALHAVTGAARTAARATAIGGVSSNAAETLAKDYMSASSFAPDSVTLEVDTRPSTVPNMDQVVCTVRIDFDAVSLIGDPFSIGASIVTGNSAMLSPQ